MREEHHQIVQPVHCNSWTCTSLRHADEVGGKKSCAGLSGPPFLILFFQLSLAKLSSRLCKGASTKHIPLTPLLVRILGWFIIFTQPSLLRIHLGLHPPPHCVRSKWKPLISWCQCTDGLPDPVIFRPVQCASKPRRKHEIGSYATILTRAHTFKYRWGSCGHFWFKGVEEGTIVAL